MGQKNLTFSRSDRIVLRGQAQSGFGDYAISMFRPQIIAASKPDPPDYALQLRNYFTRNFHANMPDSDTTNLALGFLLGDRSLSAGFKEKLRAVGLSHIVVASGYSLSIIANFARKRFGRYSRFAGVIAAVALMVSFIALTGLSPSLLRASLISILTLVAGYYGRKFHPGRLMCYVAAISVVVSPKIIFNVAWQLSFASYAGIMFFMPVLVRFFYGHRSPGFFASMLLVTVAAQAFCLPISIYNFGQASVIGIVANLIITPLIPIVMVVGLVVGAFPYPLLLFTFIARTVLSFQVDVINRLGTLKWATIDIGASNALIFLAYIPLIGLLVILKRVTKYRYHPSYKLDKFPEYGKIYSC